MCNKALTLEELRRMDGKPVWVHVVDHTVFADKEDDFDGYGLVRKSWVRVWDEKRADLIHVDYDFCGYGKEWLAYAAEPHRLDRSAWEPCEHCKPSKNPLDRWGPHQFPIDGNEIYFYDTDDGWEGEEINFCPWCGRPLTDAAWEMLERRMHGD